LAVLSSASFACLSYHSRHHPPQTAPVNTFQPTSQTVKPENAATFTLVASGTGPLHYQWKKKSANVSGDAASYTTPAMTAS
jgi:hypothetical protein